jgi:hypothetical protein
VVVSAAIASLDRGLLITEVLGHLDLEPHLENSFRGIRE